MFDGVNADGRTTLSERVSKFDGVDVPVQSVATSGMTKALRRIDQRSFEVIVKVNGKHTATNRVVVSADGKTTTGTDLQGRAVNNTAIWDKQ
jgi:hypothetical protein